MSLAWLAQLFVQWLGVRRALVPVAVIGSSLYFNTLLTTHGIDLQWAPIIDWLLWQSIAPSAWRRAAVRAPLGLSVMIACLMWPVCLFYVPAWIIGYVVRWRARGERTQTASVTIAVLSVTVPFALTAAYLRITRARGSTIRRADPASSGAVAPGSSTLRASSPRTSGG